jgi:hypothetical protein
MPSRVRVPGRVVRRGRCGEGRWRAPSHRCAHRHLPSRRTARCGAFADDRRVVKRRRRRPLYIHSFERRQTRRGSRFSSGFARLERERMMPSSHSARSSPPSVGATPAHCGAFAISGASRPAMTADGCTSFCKELRDGFGVRAPVGRVAANGSRFPPFDPIREAGAQN